MQIKNRQQLLVFGAIAIVALFAADKIIFTPLGSFWTARSKEIKKLLGQEQRSSADIRATFESPVPTAGVPARFGTRDWKVP